MFAGMKNGDSNGCSFCRKSDAEWPFGSNLTSVTPHLAHAVDRLRTTISIKNYHLLSYAMDESSGILALIYFVFVNKTEPLTLGHPRFLYLGLLISFYETNLCWSFIDLIQECL